MPQSVLLFSLWLSSSQSADQQKYQTVLKIVARWHNAVRREFPLVPSGHFVRHFLQRNNRQQLQRLFFRCRHRPVRGDSWEQVDRGYLKFQKLLFAALVSWKTATHHKKAAWKSTAWESQQRFPFVFAAFAFQFAVATIHRTPVGGEPVPVFSWNAENEFPVEHLLIVVNDTVSAASPASIQMVLLPRDSEPAEHLFQSYWQSVRWSVHKWVESVDCWRLG